MSGAGPTSLPASDSIEFAEPPARAEAPVVRRGAACLATARCVGGGFGSLGCGLALKSENRVAGSTEGGGAVERDGVWAIHAAGGICPFVCATGCVERFWRMGSAPLACLMQHYASLMFVLLSEPSALNRAEAECAIAVAEWPRVRSDARDVNVG